MSSEFWMFVDYLKFNRITMLANRLTNTTYGNKSRYITQDIEN